MGRPLGVSLIAVLSVLSGVSAMVATLSYAAVSSLLLSRAPFPIAPPVPLLPLVVSGLISGPTYVAEGIGLWRLRTWGWWLAVIYNAVGLANAPLQPAGISTASLSGLGSQTLSPLLMMPGVILNILVIAYLVVRRGFFGSVGSISKPLLVLLVVLALAPSIILGLGALVYPSP